MEKLEYHLQVFDGPLDLLLALIAKNKLDIYDIPIAELLDQYLEQIALMREADMDVASEFLEMAARLVQIKAASLLPQHEQGEEDPRAELTGQLLEYDQCKKAAAQLAAQCSFDRLTRSPEPHPRRLHLSAHPRPPGNRPGPCLRLGQGEEPAPAQAGELLRAGLPENRLGGLPGHRHFAAAVEEKIPALLGAVRREAGPLPAGGGLFGGAGVGEKPPPAH